MRVLVLATWFPYPPVHGGKNRAYHLIRALAEKHDVAVCSFEDVPVDAQSLNHMRQICRRVEVVPHPPLQRTRWRTVLGWLSWHPSHMRAGYSRQMAARARLVASEWAPNRLVAHTVVSAPYAADIQGVPRILDLDLLLSPVLHDAYRRSRTYWGRRRRWLAWQKFRRYEHRLLTRFEHCAVVSEQERQMVLALAPHRSRHPAVVPNGIDSTVNVPGFATPQPGTLIYNGALTYDANYDAVRYFLREIFPLVRAAYPTVHLRLTGTTTGVRLDRLALDGATTCTGHLEDIRPAVAGSWGCVVPLRIGGGTRVKILEAMALGTPVVSTSKGVEGLQVVSGEHVLVADTPSAFAAQTLRLLNDPALRERLARNARRLVQERYDWKAIGRRFCALVEQATTSHTT